MIIGIDIGGSTVRGVLWNGKKILRNFEFATPKNLKKFEKVIMKLADNFSLLIPPSSYGKRRGARGVALRIGIAGVIKNTIVISATNIKYLKNFNFKSLIHDSRYKILVDNDARTYARAEYNIGAGRGVKSMLMITLGTGIGRAFIKNGKILKIRRFEYAEDWEKDYQKIHNKKYLAEFLGEKLSLLIDALNPEVVVFGGGVVEKKGYYEEIKLALSSKGIGARVKKSKLGKFAGAIGAAMLWTKRLD